MYLFLTYENNILFTEPKNFAESGILTCAKMIQHLIFTI